MMGLLLKGQAVFLKGSFKICPVIPSVALLYYGVW